MIEVINISKINYLNSLDFLRLKIIYKEKIKIELIQ
tara:strand:+ start:211 stop:318 length:108 start_codon:yes stop_codon:yes gene_type:complete